MNHDEEDSPLDEEPLDEEQEEQKRMAADDRCWYGIWMANGLRFHSRRPLATASAATAEGSESGFRNQTQKWSRIA